MDGLALPADPTVTDVLSAFLAHHVAPHRRPQTHETYRRLFDVHIIPRIGGVRARELQHLTVQRAIDDVAATGRYAPATVRAVRDAFASAMKWAAANRIVDTSPALSIAVPEQDTARRAVLTRGEAARLIAALEGDPCRPFVLLGLTAGLRWAELQGLRWANVHLAADGASGAVHVVEQLERSRPPAWTTPKGKVRARRRLALPAVTARALVAQREAVRRLALRAGTRGWTDLDLVFPGPGGGPLSRPTVYRALDRACAEAKITPTIRPHDLRHAFATRLDEAGQSLTKIQRALGHAHLSTTAIYMHTTAEAGDELAEIAGAGL